MKCETRSWTTGKGWDRAATLGAEATLVLVFGDAGAAVDGCIKSLQESYPRALVAGCSSAGEIVENAVHLGSVCGMAIAFERTRVEARSAAVKDFADSQQLGTALAKLLPTPNLAHCLVFSDGMQVDGAALARGLCAGLPTGVAVTGGLAGDSDRFKETWVCCDGAGAPGCVTLIGLYGKSLKVGYGSLGGWDPFGPEMVITEARGNVLHTLNGEPALEVYERLLGAFAAGLPATGLLFPFCINPRQDRRRELVRTILAVDHESKTLTFAGEMPTGATVRLMKANFDHLVEGAVGAAQLARRQLGTLRADAALLISCVGRRLVLKGRIHEEVEAVRRVVGAQASMAGFYSYGEICPAAPDAGCELHNQTMTITTFTEE